MHLPEFTAVRMHGFAMRSGVSTATPKDEEHRQVRSRSLKGASTFSAQRDRLGVGTLLGSSHPATPQTRIRVGKHVSCNGRHSSSDSGLNNNEKPANGPSALRVGTGLGKILTSRTATGPWDPAPAAGDTRLGNLLSGSSPLGRLGTVSRRRLRRASSRRWPQASAK